MKTKLRANRQGFTIVEVMIVLAVTGALFLSVVVVISGKQQSAEFESSLNDLRSQMQQIGSEVGSGYYPDNGSYGCTASGSPATITITAGSPANDAGGCIFLGKALHFYHAGGSADDIFSAYTMAGARVDSAINADYASADPFLVAPTSSGSSYHAYNAGNIDVTTNSKLEYGLSAATMTYTNATGDHPLGSFAFVQSLNASGSTASNGSSQHVGVMVFTDGQSKLTNDPTTETDALDNALHTGAYELDDPITICFNSGTTAQSGLIIIDNASNQLDVKTKVQGVAC